MKIQLDTTNKTIKLEDRVEFSELIKTLNKLLPKGEWKKFTLETHTVINNWASPVVFPLYPIYKSPPREIPWYTATWDGVDKNDRCQLKAGTYNIETKL